MTGYAHKLVASTAKEMAEELFEDVMRDDAVYAAHKRICPELTPKLQREMFVKLMVPHLLEQARATLAKMLETNIKQSLKDEIVDALLKDQTFRHFRNNRQQRRAATAVTKH